MLHIKKKDRVKVLSGKDAGKTGEVLKIFPGESRVVVSKINFQQHHTRPTQTDPGGKKEIEGAIHISTVQLVCPKCNQPTRIKVDWLGDGKKVRICKKCGEMVI